MLTCGPMAGPAQRRAAARVALCCALVTALGCTPRQRPGVVLPEPRGAATSRDLSRKGQDRGDIEIALGSVVTAVATTLVVLGSIGVQRTVALRAYCDRQPEFIAEQPDPRHQAACSDPLGLDPVRSAGISSGLALAFAIPIAVGGGFLLRKGVRMRKDYKARQAVQRDMSLRPWLDGQRAGGLGLSLRF